MWALLARLLLVAALIYTAWRLFPMLRRALGRLEEAEDDPAPLPGPHLVAIQRTPFDVLGISEDASPEQVRTAWLRVLAENSPERVAGMSPEIRELAARRTREANEAYAELAGTLPPDPDDVH